MVCAETCLAGSIACLAVPAINRWDLCDSLRVVLLVYQLTKQGQAFSARQLIVLVLIVGPKLFIEPGTKAFFRLSSVSGPGL